MPNITVEPDYTDADFAGAVEELLAEGTLVTSPRVAERVGCSRELARQYLVARAEEGALKRDRVGGGAVVYLPPDDTLESARKFRLASGQDGVAPAQSDADTDAPEGVVSTQEAIAPAQSETERVMFFPSRREIAVDYPSDRTRSILSQTAHIVDSRDDGFLYKISEADIWSAPYDSFEELRGALETVVGDESWDGGFESRIEDDWGRANEFTIRTHEDGYTILEAKSEEAFENVAKRHLEYNDHYTQFVDDTTMRLKSGAEAEVKETLYEQGYPAVDQRRLDEGASLDIRLREDIELRDYQQRWVDHFRDRNAGVFVGPSGSGKTVAALGAMEAVGGETLILVPGRELAQQWQEELQEKTEIGDAGILQNVKNIGQYHGGQKEIRPITIATYDTAAMSRHRKLFNEREWGLVIADECHHAVADTWKRFREIQSVARLGLSATPVRESEDAQEIYTLIGPPVGSDWGRLFAEGWVEKPDVTIVEVPWASGEHREAYQRASGSKKLIEAARNPTKADAVGTLLERHAGEQALVFVDWIKQGKDLSEALDLPFIYGETSHDDRQDYYAQFRAGDVGALIVSRVGDEGIDLPDAEVAILASTMGSSRAQTGQRAGRTMRPSGSSQVYILLTKGSGEEDWGRESTQYLAEKGVDITRMDYENL